MSTKDRKLFIFKQTKNCQPVRTSSKTNKIRGFNSSRVTGRSTYLQRADYPLGAFTRTSSN